MSKDSSLEVQECAEEFLDKGGVPQRTYPGMMLFIDDETQRGMVALIPLLLCAPIARRSRRLRPGCAPEFAWLS